MRRLLIRPGAIGDVILSLPAMEHLKTDYTEVWAPRALVPLIQFADKTRAIADTGIEALGVGELPVADRLREQLGAFDEIVSWYGASREEFRQALCKLNQRCRFYSALPAADCSVHAADFYALQVGARPGMVSRIAVNRVANRGTVAIHPFSGSARKNWPLARFRELAENFEVEWIAGPEQDLEGAVRFESLRDLAEWLTGTRLYVGNDSGVSHLAAAIGVPAVVLFGPSDLRVWAPRGDNVTVLQSAKLEELSVEQVRLHCK